jgi:signal transduction histidine kinase
VFCELLENTNLVKIFVRDSGIGIKDEDKEKLFVPFELLDDGKALNPSGTGIGLSSCHKMLTAIGCSIELEESIVGKGSTFSFTILSKKVQTKVK